MGFGSYGGSGTLEGGAYVGNTGSKNDSSTGNYYSSGSGNVYGGSAGLGFSLGFYSGNTSGFSGSTTNSTVFLGPLSFTYSNNSGGWGFGASFGGKGFGLGYSKTTSNTSLIGGCATKGLGN